METNGDIEARLRALELQVAELKQHVGVRTGNWFDEVTGSMKDVPDDVYAEFKRCCREVRDELNDLTE